MKQLRDDILIGLNRSATVEELLEIVRRFKSQGVDQKVTYDTLEDLWKELGCQGSDDETLACSLLEAIMDRVWGYCSAKDAIWDNALEDNLETR